jgi:hypothetical protein
LVEGESARSPQPSSEDPSPPEGEGAGFRGLPICKGPAKGRFCPQPIKRYKGCV